MAPELKKKSDISIVLIVFTAMAVIGVACGGFVVHDYARSRASLAWPAADGIVLSRLEGERAPLRYVYSFDGRSYEATRTRTFLGWFMTTDKVDYRPGESVIVYVDPEDHGYAVIYPGGASFAFVILSLLSGAAVFFGVGGVVWALSRTREEVIGVSAHHAF
ncbi:DUF3592 domain-containing protein [Hyphococcus sp.]|uniref:DUF3592 domain-containing protein n=1 Tax=Hyphococcus sp. TaxID=2038636 RepID=UPI0035C6A888